MGKRALAATVLLVGVVAAQDGAAWKLPAAGPEVLLKLKLSKRTYILGPESRAPKEADGPERIQPKRESYDQGLLKVARYQIEHGELDKAEKLIAEVVERNTADAGALTLKALLLHKQGKPKQALAALRESLIQNRRNPDAWRLLRQVAKDLGRKVVRPPFPHPGLGQAGTQGNRSRLRSRHGEELPLDLLRLGACRLPLRGGVSGGLP